MDLKFYMLYLLLSQIKLANGEHVSGIITDTTTFFYRKLPVSPFISGTIEFKVSYIKSLVKNKYPLMGIYTNYPKVNTEKSCSYVRFGQLRNENLHLFLRVGRYRTTTCTLSGNDTVKCTGRVAIQDYIPRKFYLTFGFHCGWPRINSLHGLKYNISFTGQRNDSTICTHFFGLAGTGFCSRFYKDTSLPNLIGDEYVYQVVNYLQQFVTFEALIFMDGTCYQHF